MPNIKRIVVGIVVRVLASTRVALAEPSESNNLLVHIGFARELPVSLNHY